MESEQVWRASRLKSVPLAPSSRCTVHQFQAAQGPEPTVHWLEKLAWQEIQQVADWLVKPETAGWLEKLAVDWLPVAVEFDWLVVVGQADWLGLGELVWMR